MRATSFSVPDCNVFLPSVNKVIYLFIYLDGVLNTFNTLKFNFILTIAC